MAVACLSLLVAVGAALPSYARLVGGPAEHVCHCEARGAHAGGSIDCACPICFPELRSFDDAFAPNLLKGSCGDDDPGWKTDAVRAVPPALLVILAAPPARVVPLLEALEPAHVRLTPEPRPPRQGRAALS